MRSTTNVCQLPLERLVHQRLADGRHIYVIPQLDFAGAPTGIDLIRSMELNLLPAINTGIAHREPGVGQVGAGLTRPPWECFHRALEAFAEHVRAHAANR